MSTGRLSLATGLVALLAGCSAARIDQKAEQSALMQVSREWAQAAASGDLERIVSYWADDAMVLPPDVPAVVGKAAIREYVSRAQAIPGFSITWEPEQARIASGGGMGYLVERNKVTAADANGLLHTEYGKAVTVWRKDAGGAWKCVIDIWNTNPQERVLSRAAWPRRDATAGE